MVIESLGVYLPADSVSTAEMVAGCRVELAFPLERMTGIRSRRMAGKSEFSYDLAAKAVRECFARSEHGPGAIDLLICCNISRCDGPGHAFSFEPSTASRLQAAFGMGHALAFDVSNACAGTFTALTLADAYLKSGAARRARVVSVEYISHLSATAQREITGFVDARMACLTLGDSGVATILERADSDLVGFHDLDLFTLGKYSDLCVAKLTDQPHGGAIMVTDLDRSHTGFRDGRASMRHDRAASIEPTLLEAIKATVAESLDREGVAPDDLAVVLPPHGSAGFVARLAGSLGLPSELFVTLPDGDRDDFTSSLPCAFRAARDAGRVAPGGLALIIAAGSGIQVGCCLYHFA